MIVCLRDILALAVMSHEAFIKVERINEDWLAFQDLKILAPSAHRLEWRLVAIGDGDVRREWVLAKFKVKPACQFAAILGELGKGVIGRNPGIERAGLPASKPSNP